MFQDKVVVVTGGASGIGKTIVQEFKDNNATVCVIDIQDNDYFVGDLSSQEVISQFVKKVINDYGKIDILVNNALPLNKGIDACTYQEFNYALSVGVTAPFYLSQLFLPYFSKQGSIINIISTRAFMSQPNTESYSASKGGLAALTHALAISLAGKVRGNSIAPGWIDTESKQYSGSDAKQHPVQRVGNPLDIANMVLFLSSEKASFITGENITIDGGMSKQMIYSDDYGWEYKSSQ